MASLALHLKSHHHHKPSQTLLNFSHFYSTSSNDGNSPDKPPSNFSSYFSDFKSRLKQESTTKFNPSNFTPQGSHSANPSSKVASFDEVRKNLSEFRRRSAPETPFPANAQKPSLFPNLYNRNIGNPNPNLNPNSAKGGNLSFGAIRDSLRQLKEIQGDKGRNMYNDQMSLNKYKEALRVTPPLDGGHKIGSNVIGGSFDSLPTKVFGKEIKEKEMKKGEGDKDDLSEFELVKTYNYVELGQRLRELRPDTAQSVKKKKGEEGWFSLSELQERLGKLKEMEEKLSAARMSGASFVELRKSLRSLRLSQDEKPDKKTTIQRFDILSQPSLLQSPPKEHLVEKYFHPDNMSAAEKLKIELKRVRDEFKMSESDCGSTRVQIAQLTTEISHLSSVLHKKDKHSRRGLQAKVQQRKKLLKYLRRTDWDSYCFVLSKLGLRDNPDYKN